MAPPLTPYLATLKALPFVQGVRVRESKEQTVDGWLQLTTTSKEVFTLPFEQKRSHLSRALGEQLVLLSQRHPNLLVFAPVVGRDLGHLFTQEGVNFVDLAGNCHLRIGDRYLANVQGQRTPQRLAQDRSLRAPALRVLFALLVDPELAKRTTRQIASAAGAVSPQTASDLLKRLESTGALARSRGTVRWLPGGRRQALDLLTAGLPSLVSAGLIGRYRARPAPLDALEAELTKRLAGFRGTWRWGGGAAAQRLTGFYRGDRTVLYLDTKEPAIASSAKLVPDPAGPIALFVAPGPLAFTGPDKTTVHPLLVYLDLLNEEDDRARDAAAELYRKFLEDSGR